MIKVEKGIKPPMDRVRYCEIFESMEIGDSFSVPYVGNPTFERQKIYQAVNYWKGKTKTVMFKLISDTRVEDNKKVVRFWRVK